jgi:hypothetical protein
LVQGSCRSPPLRHALNPALSRRGFLLDFQHASLVIDPSRTFWGRFAVSIYFYILLFTNRFCTAYIVCMPMHHDPETRQILNDLKTQRDAEWCRRQIGDATYLRSLMILGYSDHDAQTELNLLKLLRR